MKSKSVISSLKDKENKQKELFQIFVILLGSLGGLTCGMLVAWPSPFLLKIVEDKVNYNITEQQASFFTVFSIVGVVFLTPIFIPLVNRIGTKKAIILASIPYIAVWLIKAFVTNLYGLYSARNSNPKVRGLWGNAFICSLFTGQCLINILGAYLSVKTTSLIAVVIPLLLLVIFPFMPDSPYFCIAKGRHEEAKQHLKRLRQKTDIEEEFKAIEAAVHRQLSESGSWKDLFVIKTNRKALFAAFFLRNSQLWGGMMTFAAYTQFIFIKSGTNVDPKISAIIYAAKTLSEKQEGIFVNSEVINNLRYVDDTVLLASRQEDLQTLLNSVIESCREAVDLHLKKKKKARAAFRRMSKVLCKRDLKLALRIRLLRCYVFSVLLYGVEFWTVNKIDLNRLEAFKMWCYKRILKVSWVEKIQNFTVLERLSKIIEIIKSIKQRKLEYFGHVMRGV
ncbi:unnamed protein product [Diabrotica balteata]|uniref:Uncharacterized protein n=1 Tax=Diabrotica balteata TaxID=107213 RepID=A0A9N9T9L1_DIABA|nr:unnamed protein product [Diabrotica balteata]